MLPIAPQGGTAPPGLIKAPDYPGFAGYGGRR